MDKVDERFTATDIQLFQPHLSTLNLSLHLNTIKESRETILTDVTINVTLESLQHEFV